MSLSARDRILKRALDLTVAGSGLIAVGWLILLLYLLARADTGQSGFFSQIRVGRGGRLFKIYKIRTMRSDPRIQTSVTSRNDPRITRLGAFLRRTKLDELPQLWNLLKGEMSLVGPRPDVPGFADRLRGDDRLILTVRPGITGPATLRFRAEEDLLSQVGDPERFNREVLFPAKVRINRQYVEEYTFAKDLIYIWRTLPGRRRPSAQALKGEK